jgi:hypothetical protein
MGDGRSTERFMGSESTDFGYSDVAPSLGQEAYERTQSTSQPATDWRGGYGGVAPAFGTPGDQGGAVPPTTTSTDWRGGYNQVAPGFQGDGSGQQPGTGTDYRGGYGQVAPIFGDGGTTPGGTTGGTRTPYGEVVPPWPPRQTPNVPDRGSINPDGTPRTGTSSGTGSGLRQQVDRTAPLIEKSLEPRTSFWGNEIIGGVSGGLFGPGGLGSTGLSYGAKWYLSRSEGMLSWVKSTREAGAPVEGSLAKAKYGLASVAEKPIGWGQKGAQWWENNFGVKTGNGPIKDLKVQDSKLTQQIEAIAEKIKPDVDRITEKMMKQGAESLSAQEKAVLDVHRFLREGGTGAVPEGAAKVLTQSELMDVARFQQAAERMKPFGAINPNDFMRYVQALESEAATAGAVDKILERLKPQMDDITRKVSAGTALTEAEQAVLNTHKFLKGEGGTLAQGVLTAEELVAVTNHQRNIAEVRGLGADKAFAGTPVGQLKGLLLEYGEAAGKMEGILKKLEPQAEELAKKAKSFTLTAEEQAILQKYNYLKGAGEAPPAGVLTAEEAALVSQRNMIRGRLSSLESELAKMPRGARAFFQNFAKGMMVVGASQFVNDRLDRQLFGKFHNSSSDFIDSIVVPAAFLLPGGWLKKGAAMVGGHLLGKYLIGDWLDKKMGVDKDSSWNRFLRPTGVEAFAVAGAFLLPMRAETPLKRLALVGGAMLASKVSNYLLSDESAKEKRDDAVAAFVRDKSERSADSMNDAIEEFKDLGRANEPALKWYLADWLSRKHDDKLNGHRGLAILFTAAGEVRLDRGTAVGQGNGKPTSNPVLRALSFKNNSYEYDNILAGYNLDLGGRALVDLVSARMELDRAKQQTEYDASRGLTVKDRKVEQSEVAELEKVGKRIDGNLAKVYGEHDIPGAMKELQEWIYKLNQRDADKLIRQPLKARIANPGARDDKYINNTYMAKLYRDLALVDLAWAGIKVGYNGVGEGKDGASAAIMYQEAVAALRQAKALDPNNPDIPQLERIAQDLGKTVPQAQSSQMSNPTSNPLNVENGLYNK